MPSSGVWFDEPEDEEVAVAAHFLIPFIFFMALAGDVLVLNILRRLIARSQTSLSYKIPELGVI